MDSYKVLLKDNTTGEERWHKSDFPWADGCTYLWTEGNFSCDCNRHLFFARAAGEEEEDEFPCGETRYTAICAELPDGTRLPIDTPELTGEGR